MRCARSVTFTLFSRCCSSSALVSPRCDPKEGEARAPARKESARGSNALFCRVQVGAAEARGEGYTARANRDRKNEGMQGLRKEEELGEDGSGGPRLLARCLRGRRLLAPDRRRRSSGSDKRDEQRSTGRGKGESGSKGEDESASCCERGG